MSTVKARRAIAAAAVMLFNFVSLPAGAAVLDDPKAKNYTPQQLMDLSLLP